MLNLDIVHSHQMEQFLVEVCLKQQVDLDMEKIFKLPYQPGDILYVRETWMDYAGLTMYKADCDKYRLESLKLAEFSWKPSIHMPKEAARIWLKVTDVRVERLQEISEDGAKAEGANFKNGKNVGFEEKMNRTAIERFTEIWNSTIKNPTLTGMVGMQIRGYG